MMDRMTHKKVHDKSKIVELTVRPTREVLKDFATTLRKVRKGQKVESRVGISFESIDGLRKVLTRRRLELLSIVKREKPQSVYELSKFLKRDLKSVNTDLKVLEENDLIEFKRVNDGRQRLIPKVSFDNIKITVEV
ncbi:hypothetical protein CMO93_05505 [Candidatus Woesearchaeota archaeon]|nr:hypothetical protein [Candidatus Woesearchaeota archaeon]